MRPYHIIYKKREGQELSKDELEFFINKYVSGEIPDYQVSAWAMAVYFQGLTQQEILDLTQIMINSGETIEWTGIEGAKVDKHSTGGVGDKTTLVLGPILAALGIKFPKLAGRGLGHTGGTIDKLESIPGFIAEISGKHMINQVSSIGLAIAAQSNSLVPADKKLYALRDVTATVESIPLIASSIMSKKLACGAEIILLDVKVGSGALMKSLEDARELAEVMIKIGKDNNKSVVVVLSNMEQPLGKAVGNALEVEEAINTLKGKGPSDLYNLCKELAAHAVVECKKASDINAAKELVDKVIKNGQAYDKILHMIEAQKGNYAEMKKELNFYLENNAHVIKSPNKGWVTRINALEIGLAAVMLGSGRKKKDDIINPHSGVILNKKVGDWVNENDVLATVYGNKDQNIDAAITKVLSAYGFHTEPVNTPQLIYDVFK